MSLGARDRWTVRKIMTAYPTTAAHSLWMLGSPQDREDIIHTAQPREATRSSGRLHGIEVSVGGAA